MHNTNNSLLSYISKVVLFLVEKKIDVQNITEGTAAGKCHVKRKQYHLDNITIRPDELFISRTNYYIVLARTGALAKQKLLRK